MPSAHKGQRLYWDRGPLARRERETRDKGGQGLGRLRILGGRDVRGPSETDYANV